MRNYIFQISTEKVDRENYLNESTMVNGSNSELDWCADIDENDREKEITRLVNDVLPKGMFTRIDENTIRYNGGMEQWKMETIAKYKERVEAITPDNYFDYSSIYGLECFCEDPLCGGCLFYLNDSGYAESSQVFMNYVDQLEKESLLYIGGVVMYHS